MKKVCEIVKAVVPHISIGFSVAFIVILVIDMFINDAMGFISSGTFKWMCLINCVTTILSCGFLVSKNRKDARRKIRKEAKTQRNL